MHAPITFTAQSGHGWLTAILPAGARRLRTDDPGLAETLGSAGAELVEEAADVEIVSSRRLRGDAELAVVVASEDRPEGGPRVVRGSLRVARAIRVRARARAARTALRRSGYAHISNLLGDVNAPLSVIDGVVPDSPRLPLRATVVGRKTRDVEPSILQEAVQRANIRPLGQPLVREGVVVVVGDHGVLRVSLGSGRRQAEEQGAALALLGSQPVPAVIANRVPWPLDDGEVGLGHWFVERRLPGASPASVTDTVAAQCLEFLIALHAISRDGRPQELMPRAEIVARAVRPDAGRALFSLAQRLDASLAHVPRGFAHGDFCRGNLLVDDGQLSGVVDWDHAGGGRLPLLDLYHLRVNEQLPRRRISLGRSVLEQLLPTVAAGGDPAVRDYCAAVALEPKPSLLIDLALAYWLDFVARELELYANRASRPHWMQENVYLVVEESARWFR